MTVRALLGLAVANVVVLAAGGCLLWGVRGLRSWAEAVRLSGLAYMVGVAALGVASTVLLVAGVPYGVTTILVTSVVLAVSGLLLGQVLGRPPPRLRGGGAQGIGLVAASYVALVGVYLEALFRAGRLAPLSNFDGWAFWVPKAKAIYFFGGLDEQFFRELANPTYPPLVPALEAAAFHAMGSADTVTLHVQFWFFLTGFVAAVAGVLGARVHAAVLGPVLLVVLVAPRVVARSLEPQADFLLDYFFALAALLVALWLVERRAWQLSLASLFLAGAMLTKREGQLLAACVLVAAVAAPWGRGGSRGRQSRSPPGPRSRCPAVAPLVQLPRPHRRVPVERAPQAPPPPRPAFAGPSSQSSARCSTTTSGSSRSRWPVPDIGLALVAGAPFVDVRRARLRARCGGVTPRSTPA